MVGGAFPVMGGAYGCGCGRGSGLIVVNRFLYSCLVGGAWGLWAGLVMGGRGVGFVCGTSGCGWGLLLWAGLLYGCLVGRNG